MGRVVVVDVETTGLWRTDRVVEIACVTVDLDLGVVDEWSTLLNPLRDVSLEVTEIHGLAASELSSAPTFAEIAGHLGAMFAVGPIVAHNVAFDTRMLKLEFDRLGMDWRGRGFCTMRAAGERGAGARNLVACCDQFNVAYGEHHHALADAQATAALLLRLAALDADIRRIIAELKTVSVSGAAASGAGVRSQPRQGTTNRREFSYLRDLAATLPAHPELGSTENVYMAILDNALNDLVLTDEEQLELEILASELGLGPADRRRVHEIYLEDLHAAALRDHQITARERSQLDAITAALGEKTMPTHSSEENDRPPQFGPGTVVCFTGDAPLSVEGQDWTRALAERIAADAGMTSIGSVTKKCQLVVAGDTSTMSGKAQKARNLGITVLSVVEYLDMLGVEFDRY